MLQNNGGNTISTSKDLKIDDAIHISSSEKDIDGKISNELIE